MQFVVKPETNVYEIEAELKTTFGTLLTDADIEALLNSLSIQSGMATNLSVVDLYPLYEEILARFQTRLHTDDGVMTAEEHMLFTQANLEKEIVDRPTTHCTSQGGNGNSQGCKNKAIIQEAREAAETAAEAYYDLLSKKHNSMIDAGMLPIMDVSLEHQQQGREMFVETSLLVIGSIIPLTATDLAIEAATLGFGKFAKIANKAGDLLIRLKTGGMSSRAKSVSEEAAERIADARKAKKDAEGPIENVPEGSFVLNDGLVRVEPAGKPELQNSLTSNEKVNDRYLSNENRFNELAADPDQGNKILPKTRLEAAAGIEAELKGLVPGPIQRGPEGIEFYDSQGNPWDVKTPRSPDPSSKKPWAFPLEANVNSIKKELRGAKEINGVEYPGGKYLNEKTGEFVDKKVIINSNRSNQGVI